MKDLIVSFKHCLLSLLVFGGGYTLLVLAFAMVVAPEARIGSLLTDVDGTIRGASLIGQSFTQPKYFRPRPSAVNYDASATGGSNLSPKNPEISERAKGIVDSMGLSEGQFVPADLVTASGSGVEPHITYAAALLQTPRVAQARGLSEESLRSTIDRFKDSFALEVLGAEPLVNVLMLNMALDKGEE
jgi:K+-transporting ATPase ATPase C chain